jgi:limonene-1,2-epoxide hydrolase
MAGEAAAVVRSFLDAMKGGTDEAFADAVTRFSARSSYAPNGWKAPVVGRDAVLAELRSTGAHYSQLAIEVVHLVEADGVVAAERVDRFVMGGTPVDLHVVGIFEVGSDGLITAWRDYYDRAEVDRQVRR